VTVFLFFVTVILAITAIRQSSAITVLRNDLRNLTSKFDSLRQEMRRRALASNSASETVQPAVQATQPTRIPEAPVKTQAAEPETASLILKNVLAEQEAAHAQEREREKTKASASSPWREATPTPSRPTASQPAPPPKPPSVPPPSASPPQPIDWEQQVGARLPVWIGGIAVTLAGVFLVKYFDRSGLPQSAGPLRDSGNLRSRVLGCRAVGDVAEHRSALW
jgi:uncharacterized membrane protein